MEELVLELKKEIIEALNLEDITPEDIDADAPLLAAASVSTPLTPWNSSC